MAQQLEDALANIQKALMAAQDRLRTLRASPEINEDAVDHLDTALITISGALDEGFDACTRLTKG